MDTFIIWMAGYFEANGTTTNDINNNNHITLFLLCDDECILAQCVQRWGGVVNNRKWRVSNLNALSFVNDIKPYMRTDKINIIYEAIKRDNEGLCKRFKCRWCEKDYASPGGRRRHENFVHRADCSM
jgi:hypothetical protein